MVDALLLEWEGVLADTRAARRDALVRALAVEGVASTAQLCDICSHGWGVRAAATAALRHAGIIDHVLSDLVALRAERAFLAAMSGGILLAPGAAAFVAEAQQSTRVAIATRAGRAETDLLLRLSGLDAAIATVVAAEDDVSVALYQRALEQLGRVRAVSPQSAALLADAPEAFRAARAAGLRTLAVGAPAHEAMEADAAVASLEGLSMKELERLLVPARTEPLA